MREEEEIIPGIYLTRGKPAIQNYKDDQNLLSLSGEQIISMQKELRKQLKMLKNSNDEMKEFDPQGTDKDIQDAIKENEAIIEKKEEQLMILEIQVKNNCQD